MTVDKKKRKQSKKIVAVKKKPTLKIDSPYF